MALLAAESFDNGTNSNILYTFNAASVNTTGGIYDTGCGFVANNTSYGVNSIQRNFRYAGDATSNVSINFSFWFKASGPPTSGTNLKTIVAGDRKYNWWGTGIGFDTVGRVTLWNHRPDAANYNQLDTGDTFVCDNNWHFIEYNALDVNSGSAYIYLYVDGKFDGSYIGSAFYTNAPTRYDYISFTNLVGNGCRFWIDDLTVWDQTGTTFVGYPKGPIRVQTLRPTVDMSSINVTSTGANNFGMLDEANGVDISDYITLSNTANAVMAISNLASDTTNVYGLITYASVSSGQGGFSNVKIGHKIDSTFNYTGAQTYFSKTYSHTFGVIENNFVNAGNLLIQNVNDMLISIDRVP